MKILEEFGRGFPAGAMVRDVTAADLREYVARLRKNSPKLKAESINRYPVFASSMFRHAATTEMFWKGVDMGTVKSIAGHTDTTMALRYAHASHASRRRGKGS